MLLDPEALRQWRDSGRKQSDADKVLCELAALAPELAVESCLATIAALSPATDTGAEQRLLRLAVGDAGRRFADALSRWAENRSANEHF